MERKCKRCGVDISHKKPNAVFCKRICGAASRRVKWYEQKKVREAETLAKLFPKERVLEEEKEALQFWELLNWHETGIICHHCHSKRKFYRSSIRLGLLKCADCKKSFTCRHGTLLEDSPLPYRFWKVIIEQEYENGIEDKFCHLIDSLLGTTRKTSLFIKYRLENEEEFLQLKMVQKSCNRLVRQGLLKKDEEKKYYTIENWEKKYGKSIYRFERKR